VSPTSSAIQDIERLPTTQRDLVLALQNGVAVHYIRPFAANRSDHYFRSDTLARCTSVVRALLKRGLVAKRYRNKYSYDHEIHLMQQPDAAQPTSSGSSS
jgi:hypothetical protein